MPLSASRYFTMPTRPPDTCLYNLQATGWTKVGKHSKDKGAVPDQDKEQRLQASPSSADRADDQNLKKAIKVCPGP